MERDKDRNRQINRQASRQTANQIYRFGQTVKDIEERNKKRVSDR